MHERKLRSELQDLKKDRIKIDALIQKIMQENSLLKQASSQHVLRQIRRSSVAMRSAHRRHKIMYKNTECKLKKENALLIKKVNELESANDLLLSERSQLVERDEPKCISSKDGKKEYNLACRKAIYYCLEYNVPINSVCPTIRTVLKELADIPVDFLPDHICGLLTSRMLRIKVMLSM